MIEYRQQNLDGIVFDGQDLTDAIFDRCNINHCSFKKCKMKNVTFDRCNCVVCNFEDVTYRKSIKFINTNIITEEDELKQHHFTESDFDWDE